MQDAAKPFEQLSSTRVAKSNQYDPVMRSERELSLIRKVQILRQKHTPFDAYRIHNSFVSHTDQTLIMNRMNIVPGGPKFIGQLLRQVLVELDLQRSTGTSRIGKSSTTQAAA